MTDRRTHGRLCAVGAVMTLALARAGDAQIVPPPSGDDLLRWSRECLRVTPAAWPTIDVLHDQLIEALRDAKEAGDAAVARQTALEQAFFDDIRAVIEISPDVVPCVDSILLERTEARLRAVLEARRIQVRVASANDVFSGLSPASERGRAVIAAGRASAIEGLHRAVAMTKDAGPNTSRSFRGASPLTPGERTAANAIRTALDRLQGEVAPEALAAASDRWERGFFVRASPELDFAVVTLRNLRSDSADERAKAAAIADEIERASAERRHAAARELMDERTTKLTADSPSTIDASIWPRIRELRPGEDGERLEHFCHWSSSLSSFAQTLRELVTDDGVERLAPFIRMSADDRGATMAERLAAREKWEEEMRSPWSSRAPSDDDVARLRAIVAPNSADASSAFDAAIATWRGAYASRVPEAFADLGAARSEAHEDGPSAREVHAALRLEADAIGAVAKALFESEDRLRDAVMPLCRDDVARQDLALWRLDRLCRVCQVRRGLLDINSGPPALLRGPWSERSVAAIAEFGADVLLTSRSALAATCAELESLLLEHERASRIERQREAAMNAVSRAAEGPRSADGSVALDEAYLKRSAELAELVEHDYPPPTRDSRSVWNAWADARNRMVASWGAQLQAEVTAAIVRDWGLRSLPYLDRSRDRAEIERLAAEHANDSAAVDAIVRARTTADHLEAEVIRLVFAFRYSNDAVAMTDALNTFRARDRQLSEDRRLALVRLRRDLATSTE